MVAIELNFVSHAMRTIISYLCGTPQPWLTCKKKTLGRDQTDMWKSESNLQAYSYDSNYILTIILMYVFSLHVTCILSTSAHK